MNCEERFQVVVYRAQDLLLFGRDCFGSGNEDLDMQVQHNVRILGTESPLVFFAQLLCTQSLLSPPSSEG